VTATFASFVERMFVLMFLFSLGSISERIIIYLENSVHFGKTSIHWNIFNKCFGHSVRLMICLLIVLDVHADLFIFICFRRMRLANLLLFILESHCLKWLDRIIIEGLKGYNSLRIDSNYRRFFLIFFL